MWGFCCLHFPMEHKAYVFDMADWWESDLRRVLKRLVDDVFSWYFCSVTAAPSITRFLSKSIIVLEEIFCEMAIDSMPHMPTPLSLEISYQWYSADHTMTKSLSSYNPCLWILILKPKNVLLIGKLCYLQWMNLKILCNSVNCLYTCHFYKNTQWALIWF